VTSFRQRAQIRFASSQLVMPGSLAIVTSAVLLAGCGGSSKRPAATHAAPAAPSPSGATTPAASGGAKCNFSVSVHAPGHQPRVNRDWTIRVTLRPPTLQGRPYYQFLLQGTVVSTQYVNGNRKFTFRGHYTDPQKFPAASVGSALTFRVVVVTRCGTKYADYPIQVRQ
jgi:hypothetical protein